MANDVKVTFLGGLGDIGRNCAAVEIDNQIMLIDCGIMFPEAHMPGVNVVLPDFDYLKQNASKVVGVVCTHGHEDHIGALRYLLAEMPLKIIGSELTLALAKNRIGQANLLDQADFVEVKDNSRTQIGAFDLEFFPVTHSVPHGFATAFHTPQGVLLHSGDFKLDMTPVDGRLTDLSGLGKLSSSEGVRLLLADSTNADAPGYSESESQIGQTLKTIVASKTEKRLVVACFASHIHRIQQIADAAIAEGRYILALGRTMKNNIEMTREMGLLRIPENKIKPIEDIDNLADREICVISTGSQGESMSALARMANGDSHHMAIRDTDCIIMSSHPIPGNETGVTAMLNALIKRGAEVIDSTHQLVHTTGHAKQTELRVFHSVVKPENFVPVHGEYRHMVAHKNLALEMGMGQDNIIVCTDGDSVILSDVGISSGETIDADYIYVAGDVKDLGEQVLADRRVLGDDGFVSVVLSIDRDLRLRNDPQIVSRGWISGELQDDLHARAVKVVAAAINGEDFADAGKVSKAARRALGKFINAETRLRPMVVPVVMSDN